MATAFLKEAIEEGEKVVIQTKLKDSKGKYGRVLGDVVVDGKNINQMMVKCHLAVAYYGQSKDDVEAEHMQNRDILIKKGLHTPID
jgi:endonuclease YncB( thermonuclease family)